MSEYNNVPRIRFKGFTDVWEQRKLVNLINEYKETVTSDCTLPVLTSSKVDGVVLQEEHFGRKQNHDITGYNILPYGYCTYRNRSDGIDFTFNINKCCKMGIISKFYPVFYGNKNNINLISIILNNSKEVAREIGYTCSGTGQKVLSFLDLQKMNIIIPNSSEQDKISDLFDNLDNLITLHQRKCDTLVNVKKSLLEKMFPKNSSNIPEIRFKGFTDVWEQRKLTSFVEFYNGQTYSPLNVQDKGTLVLRSSNVQNGEISKDDLVFIDSDVVNTNNVEIGDIIVVVRNGSRNLIGKHAQIKEKMTDTVIGAFMTGIRSKNSKFVNSLLNTRIFNDEINKNMGATINQITGYMFSNMEFKIPTNGEQSKIGELFTNLDNLITLHQHKELKRRNDNNDNLRW